MEFLESIGGYGWVTVIALVAVALVLYMAIQYRKGEEKREERKRAIEDYQDALAEHVKALRAFDNLPRGDATARINASARLRDAERRLAEAAEECKSLDVRIV